MADDYDEIAQLVRNGYGLEEALNQVNQTSAYDTSATTTNQGIVELATDAEVTTGTDTARVPSVSSLNAHYGVCKAWVKFNGTGTVAIVDSYNVTSITDNGVGDYTVNFTNNMTDANFATLVAGYELGNLIGHVGQDAEAVGSVNVAYRDAANTYTDPAKACVAVFGA